MPSVGVIESNGERCYLALCRHGTPRALIVAGSPVDAIRVARELRPGRLIFCDRSMAPAAVEANAPVRSLGAPSLEAIATMALTTATFRRREDMEAVVEPQRFSRACARAAAAHIFESPLATTLLQAEAIDPAGGRDQWSVFLAGERDLLGVALLLTRYEVPIRIDRERTVVVDVGSSIRLMVKFDRASGDLRELLRRAWQTELLPRAVVSLGHGPADRYPDAAEWAVLTGVLEALLLMNQGRASATVDVRGTLVTVREHEASVLLHGEHRGSA